MLGGQQSIEELVNEWLRLDQNPSTRDEIKNLVKNGETDELKKRLGNRIQFGTAGLRAKMEAGFSRMNDVTVLQASQGLASYVEDTVSNATERGVVIGHDHRHNSRQFANLTALAFLQKGFKVYLYGRFVHTPMVPFGVQTLKASCGIMITASHNPAADNGYKVYWGNGCQIIPPHDSGIAGEIERNLEPWSWNIDQVTTSDLVSNPVEEMESLYFEDIKDKLVNKSCNIKFVYTPMHGVGLHAMKKAAGLLRLTDSLVIVEDQAEPNPDFPTVSFPNPEEKGALKLAKEVADKSNIDIIIASDPDADRFAAAVKDPKTHEWVQLTGNQIGILFAASTLDNYSKLHNGDVSKLALLNSTVSSQMLKSIADSEKFLYEDTLTGFKWIGNRAIQLENEGYDVPFAFEEAIGYMFGVVHDKDGISAAVAFLQMADTWKNQGITALDYLDSLSQKYGYFEEANSYYISEEPQIMDDVFSYIRSYFNTKDEANHLAFPQTLGRFNVVQWRDLTTGYDSSTPDHVPLLPVSPDSQMITASLKSSEDANEEIRFTVRGSGTEPKLKAYIEARSGSSDKAKKLASEVWDMLAELWFRPETSGLKVPDF